MATVLLPEQVALRPAHMPCDDHQPTGGAGGQVADVAIADRAALHAQRNPGPAQGKTPEQIDKDSDRDYHISADEAGASDVMTT